MGVDYHAHYPLNGSLGIRSDSVVRSGLYPISNFQTEMDEEIVVSSRAKDTARSFFNSLFLLTN